MLYSDDGGLKYDVDTCDISPANKTVRGYAIKEYCSCNTCLRMCSFDQNVSMPVLNGFSFLTVGIVYLIVIIFTIIIAVLKSYFKKKYPRSRASTMSEISFIERQAMSS
jgi:hypothetical protein